MTHLSRFPAALRVSRAALAPWVLFLLAVLFPQGAPRAQAFKYWDVADRAQAPAKLSQTGLYPNIATLPAMKKKLIAGAMHFDVNSALWSDDAHKMRWVLVKPGKSIGFGEKEDYWKYPDSTVFIKQFALDTVPGDTTTRVLWETRLLINKREVVDSTVTPMHVEDQWYGFSYKWDADQKDAALIPQAGMSATLRVYPDGRGQPSRMKKWVFPSSYQCAVCHRTGYADTLHGRSVLGFFTAQLNRPHPDSAGINQLEFFFKKGLLTGIKPTDWKASPKWAPIDDPSATVDLRARSYIAANCSGCHGPRGMGTGATYGANLNYDFFTGVPQMEFRHRSTSPRGLDTLPPFTYPIDDHGNNPKAYPCLKIVPALVVPGYPQKSLILFRQRNRDTVDGDFDPVTNQMPPLASFQVNATATALIEKWIREMPAIAAPTEDTVCAETGVRPGQVNRGVTSAPLLMGRLLRLPAGMPGLENGGVTMVAMLGLDGREIPLRRLAPGLFEIPASARTGVYMFRMGKRTVTRGFYFREE